jgi:cytochrome c-type biogenesis protein CcmF
VHTFAVSSIGPWFLGFLGACLLFSVGLLAFRSGGLKANVEPAPAVSREGAFALQNLLLIGVIAVVFWGTVLPLVSGLAGQERVVGVAYYERAAGPLFAAILLLMAAGPLVPWRHAGGPLWRSLRWPAAAFAVVLVALVAAGVRSIPALLAIPSAFAVASTVLYEYARAIGRWRLAGGGWSRALALVARRRRHYGAYLAHLGLAVVVIGLAASHFWQQEKDVTLQPGQQVSIAGYTLTYSGVQTRELADHSELVAAMRFGDQTLEPARATYAGLGGQSLTHVAISSTAMADVYVVLAGTNGDGSASFRVLVNPLVSWIWVGGAIIILGVVLGNAGARRAAFVPAASHVPSPVGAS